MKYVSVPASNCVRTAPTPAADVGGSCPPAAQTKETARPAIDGST
jgi:hypothetical protein